MLTLSHEQQLFPSMPPQKLRGRRNGTMVGDREGTPSFLSPSRRMVRCCLKRMNSCATAPGEHFPSMADRPPLLASSSLGFGSVLRSHFSVCKLERFMRVRLVLRRLHLRYLHYRLARLSISWILWRSRGLLRILCACCLFGREFYGAVLNARELLFL